MKVVLDTNLLVSGLLNPRGAPANILRLVLNESIDIVVDERILLEYESVLRRPKFSAVRKEADRVVKQIGFLAERVTAGPLKIRIPDPDDLPFMEVAQAARADAVVTGNERHFPSRACGRIKIWSPRELLDRLAEEI